MVEMNGRRLSGSVVQPWLAECLSFRAQTVVLSALRGCDGKSKHDVSKPITRFFRKSILQNAEPSVPADDNTFMGVAADMSKYIELFLGDIDSYPIHFVLHFAHACEIVGHYHPEEEVRNFWRSFYYNTVRAMHLKPEHISDLEDRLRDCQLGEELV